MFTKMLAFVKSSASWVDQAALLSLLLIAPLLLFPYGILPFAAVGLALVMTLWRCAAQGRPRMRIEDVPLVIFLGMALLGYGISIDHTLSWPRLSSIILGLLIFFELRRSLRPRAWSTWIAVCLALIGIALALISLVGTDWDQVRMVDLPWLYHRLPTLVRGLPDSGALRNATDLFGPRWVGIIMGVMAPVFLPMLAWLVHPWVRYLAAGAFVLVTLTLLLTQSLQGLLALLTGTFVVLICINRWFWLLIPAGAVSLLSLAAWFGLDRLLSTLLAIDNPVGIAVVLRLDMWSRAAAMIRNMPFTEIGLNTFPLIQSQFYPGILIGPEAHSHNLYLQLALDVGLPGLLAFMWLITVWIVEVLRRLSQESPSDERQLLVSMLAGIVGYLAHGMIDAQMPGAKPGFVIWILLGIGAALMAPCAQTKNTRTHSWGLAWLALPLLIGVLALWKPATVYMNLGAVQAHKIMSPFPDAHIPPAVNFNIPRRNLVEATRLDPSLRQAHLLLGRIASIEGDFPAARKYYENRVTLDLVDPAAVYNPAHWLGSALNLHTSLNNTDELQKVYRAWQVRFPNRAEGYALNSLLADLYQGDPGRAATFLQAGIQAEARPPGLLEYLLETLETDTPNE